MSTAAAPMSAPLAIGAAFSIQEIEDAAEKQFQDPRPVVSDTISTATPNRKRGKSMTFRSGQSGTVVRKGQMWHGRYYVDVPGETKRRHASVPLGSIKQMKKTQAKRKLRTLLEEMGINKETHLERIEAGGRTFAAQAEWWRVNKLSLCRPSVQETMGSHLDKYLLPRFGAMPLAAIDENRVQEFIADMTQAVYKWPNGVTRKLSAKTIRNVVGVLKMITGKKAWRDWSLTLPEIPPKDQRSFSRDEMLRIIDASEGQWRVLWATLGGTGIRCGESFGLHVEDLDLATGRIFIRRSVRDGVEGPVKTKKGYRVVNIEPFLVEMLAAYLGDRKGGRVFQTRNGTPFCRSNVRRKLNQILKKLNLPPAGLHAFRHGRVSVLQANGVPPDLVTEWVGHSSTRTTSLYTHFEDTFRKQVACDVALFPQDGTAARLPFSPNSPNFRPVAASGGTA